MGFIYSQLFKSLPYPTGSYAGKTIVITGSNVGLGKEAARHYARLGAGKLVLAVRSTDKGDAAKRDIEATTGCAESVIEVWPLDMASYASVKAFAARVSAELDRVDVFIANAGVAKVTYATAELDEESITVNVVSTFLLAALVVPKLKESAAQFGTRPTLVIVSSEVHGFTKFPQRTAPDGGIFAAVSDPNAPEDVFAQQYPVSKLLEVLSVRAIAARRPASKVPYTINYVNPGLCHSELARDLSSWKFWFMKTVLARTTECGSRALVNAGSQGPESHGHYMSDCQISEPSPFVRSKEGKEVQDRVWNELVEKLEAIQPGVTSNF